MNKPHNQPPLYPSLVSNNFTRIFAATLLALSLTAMGCSKSASGSGKEGTAGFSDQDLALEEANRFGDGSIPQAKEGGLFQDIYFDYDSSLVKPQHHETIRKNASVLSGDPSIHAEIEGHCDRRGTNEYNLALGEERAKAVAAMMINFGVNPEQVSTISYGEEIPLEAGDSEDAYAKNRRAHFALYRKKDQSR